MKKTKKLVSLLLAVVMILTVIPIATMSVEAANGDYAVSSVSSNREKVVNYMREMATIKWVAEKNFSTLWNAKTGSRVYWKKGTTYYGIPYSQQYTYKYSDSGKINLGQFKDILEINNGKLSEEIGRNDCSNTVCASWRHIDKNITGDTTAGLTPGKGEIVAVGNYKYYNSGNTPKLTTCQKNGKKTMFAAYDCLQAGDAVCKNGHIMMVVSVNKSQKTIKVIHQTGSEKHYDPSSKKTTSGTKNSSWGVEETKTYDFLYGDGYIPITCKALKNDSPVSYTITAKPVTQSKTTNTSTEFNVGISPKATVYKIGVFYGTNKSAVENINVNTVHDSVDGKYKYSLLTADDNGVKRDGFKFDTAKQTAHAGYYLDLPQSKQTYYYKFVVKTSKSHWDISGMNQFDLRRDVPAAVSSLSISGEQQIGTGKATTISWSKSKLATEYFIRVTDSSGNEVYYETKGKDCNSCQTQPINTPDTYTVHLTAKNIHGSSSEMTTTFTVMPKVKASFDSGFGTPQEPSVPYGDSVTVPPAPAREGYDFNGWKNAENDSVIQPNAKINNLKSDVYYNAIWTPKNYTIKIMDGITQELLATTSQPFDTDFNVSDFVEANSIAIPEHEDFEFAGFSEDIYTVKAEEHTIYARYRWTSKNLIQAAIEAGGIKRAKSSTESGASNGYSVDVKVSAPPISAGGTTNEIKGRVIVALKTDAGRLLIETESAAFVLQPEQSDTINVFVPYETTADSQLPTVLEAYVVSNYYSAGIISNIAANNEELASVNTLEENWSYSAEPVHVGDTLPNGDKVAAVSPENDKYSYTLSTIETKESLATSLEGYTLESTRLSDPLWQGTNDYVKNWPALGNTYGSGYNNTSGVGKELYDNFSHPVTPSDNEGMTVLVSESENPIGWIYYHWCRNEHPKNKERAVKTTKKISNAGNDYNTFHCFYSTWDIGTRNYLDTTYYYQDYPEICRDSYHWAERIPVYRQWWTTRKKINTFSKITSEKYDQLADSLEEIEAKNEELTVIPSKTVVDDSYPVNSITLYTREGKQTSNVVRMYAYKPVNDTIRHEDKNIIEGGISGNVGAQYANEKAIVYIYKYTQVSDYTTEFICGTILDENGSFSIPDVQTRERISSITGDFTIAVAIEGESNAIVVGKIKPSDPYKVTFVRATGETDSNGNIINEVISEQYVAPGASAILPDESLIPQVEGQHFVCWNMSTDIVNGDMTVQAVYEPNVYAVVFVDWESRNIDIQKYSYHSPITSIPSLPDVDDDVTVEWIIGDGSEEEAVTLEAWKAAGGTVTDDMVISAKYSLKKVNLTVVDLSGDSLPERTLARIESADDSESVLADLNVGSQTLEYGDIIQLESFEQAYDDSVVIGWKNAETKEYLDSIEITEDMIIYPAIEFEDTVYPPEADVVTGEYDSAQTVTLSCETENAVIYYTTDGTDPVVSDTVLEYSAPISLTESTTLQFYASVSGKNSSGTVTELYAINTEGAASIYHLLTVYADLPQQEGEFYRALVLDSSRIDDTIFQNMEGYTYNGLFYDAEYTERFRVKSETIVEETTLYASYTPVQYTATFVDFDGTELAKVTVDYGEAAEAPIPTREGFVFIGWDSQDFECLTSDKIFTAQYCPEDEYHPIGDANCDGKLNIRDVTAIQRFAGEFIQFNDEQLALADTNGDGVVTIEDATHLQMYLAEYDVQLG